MKGDSAFLDVRMPAPVFSPGESRDRGAWWASEPVGSQSWTGLSNLAHKDVGSSGDTSHESESEWLSCVDSLRSHKL